MAISIPIWSDAFLKDDLRELPEYHLVEEDPAGFDAFVAAAREAISGMHGVRDPDEEITIARVIEPILDALGWNVRLRERSLTTRDEIDIALYADADQTERLLSETEREQVLGATGIVECKRWERDFDAAGSGGGRGGETAAQQLQRYLLIAGADSNESVRWGMLTDGGRWRLYSYRARPRERLYQIDLAALLASTDLFSQVLAEDDTHRLRTAYLLLRRESWIPAEGERESFLDRLLEQGRRRDADLADDLSEVIFKNVYPEIVRLFWQKQPGAQSDGIARAALLFLYRLLFIYYGEDRGMLNTEDPNYRPLSLRYGVRDPVAEQFGQAQFSTRSTRYWRHLQDLRAIIDQGEPDLGLTAYNGGLFADSHAILDEIELSDAELAPIIYDLSHTSNGTYVSYRNLEVQQLGSIYERLLERVPRRDEDGQPDVAISPYARKDSGSYYTPQELVDLIVEQTLRPLVEERVETFRREPLEDNDPAAAVLRLRVLDPAMGSAHFLITAVDWLAEQLVSLINSEWEQAPGYVSPVRERVWELQEAHLGLDDHTLLQRMVLKRCIYGVDKNPMAVELAQVALWLHTFTGDLPLPYLEHRIVEGDSLLGIRGQQAREYIAQYGRYPLVDAFEQDTAQAAALTARIDELIDQTLDEIERSRNIHDSTRLLDRHHRVLNLVTGLRWLSADMGRRRRTAFHEPLAKVLNGDPRRAVTVLYNGDNDPSRTPAPAEYRKIRDNANEIAERERVLHWELAFPEVMADGGFDAVIGNPPWDRIEQDEREWFAARKPEVAEMPRAADRKAVIEQGISHGDELYIQYDDVRVTARSMRLVCRTSGDYPLLSSGRTNLYSLFVERSLSLVKPQGIVGLLTPSGISADKTAADFFRTVSTTGRLGGIYDFENRRTSDPDAQTTKWFADVDTRFKFCATIIGGTERTFEHALCGFFLNGTSDLEDVDRVFPLSPNDFARINPNTGTAPILRGRRDAEIVSRIYRKHPVLVDRSGSEERKLYPVRFAQGLFNMTTDSNLFLTAEQLDDDGAYQVVGNRYKKGDAEWIPLYQGRMIHHFDHRANSVVVNPDSTHNPYVSKPVTDAEHAKPDFYPGVQYWVSASETLKQLSNQVGWVLAFRDITNATNERTMIASIAPWSAFGNKVPLLLPDPKFDASDACLLVANLDGLVLDYIAKSKMQSTSMNWYIVEQLPLIDLDSFDKEFGELTAAELVRDHVLRLTYTAYDLKPFAQDLGYEGEPYTWNPAERRQLRARLDALFFHLYNLSEDDADYILDQFPVLEKNERKQFGRYLTKHLVLGQYRALANADTEAEISESTP